MRIVFGVVSLLYRLSRKVNNYLKLKYTYLECRAKLSKFKSIDGFTIHNESEQVKKYKQKWKALTSHVEKAYMINVSKSIKYIDLDVVPSDVYYSIIEPTLNNIPFSVGLEDKSQLDWMYGDQSPHVFLKNIHGVFFVGDKVIEASDIDFITCVKSHHKVIVKQSIDSHGGRSIIVFSRKGDGFYTDSGEYLTIDYLLSKFKSNFIVQAFVNQHDFYAQFNQSSLNSLRVMTYRSVVDNEIKVLNVVLRVGNAGSYVDNLKFGGYAIGLNEDGFLRHFGVNNRGEVRSEFNGTLLRNMGKAEGIDAVLETAVKAAAMHHHSRVLGFDMCYTNDDKVKIIEVNTWDLEVYNIQLANGSLFHQYTDEVIDYCAKMR